MANTLGDGFNQTIESGYGQGGRIKKTILDMPDRPLIAPTVPVDNSVAQLFSNVSNITGKLADKAVDEWQDARIREAKEAGDVEGAEFTTDKPIQFKEGDTYVAQAFNNAAIKSGITKMRAAATNKLTELRQQYFNDPVGYEQASMKYIQDTTKFIHENEYMRAEAPILQEEMTLRMKTDGYEVKKQFTIDTTNKIEADRAELNHSIDLDNRTAAATFFTGDDVQAEAAAQTYTLNMQRKKELYHSVNPVTGRPIYNQEQIQRFEENDRRRFFQSAITAKLEDPKTTADEMMEIYNGTYEHKVKDGETEVAFNPITFIGVEEYEKDVKPEVARKLKESNDREAKMSSMWDKENAERQKIAGFKYITDIKTGAHIPTLPEVNDDLITGTINRSTADKARDIILNPPARTTDPEVAIEIEKGIQAGEDMEEFIVNNHSSIKDSDYISYMKTNAKTLNSAESSMWKQDKKDYDSMYLKRDVITGMLKDDTNIEAAIINKRNYDNNINNGMNRELARELLFASGKLSQGPDGGLFSRINTGYLVYDTETGKIDVSKSQAALIKAEQGHLITESAADDAYEALQELRRIRPNMVVESQREVFTPTPVEAEIPKPTTTQDDNLPDHWFGIRN